MNRNPFFLTLTVAFFFAIPSSAVDCPGFCVQCRNDSIAVCGAGCVQSLSCSLSTCTCSFTCRTTGGCPHSPAALRQPHLLDQQLERASWQVSTGDSPPSVTFDVIAQPDVPLGIDKVVVHNDPGRQISELMYTVTNRSGFTLRGVSLLVTFFNDRNEPLGGEVIPNGQSCAQDGALKIVDSQELRVRLAHYVDSGQRVSLAISSFRTDTQSWKSDHDSIIKSMKQPH